MILPKCTEKSFFNKVKKLSDKVAKARKKPVILEELLCEDFIIPTSESNQSRASAACVTPKEVELTEEIHRLQVENKQLKRKCQSFEQVQFQYDHQVEEIVDLNRKLTDAIFDRSHLKNMLHDIKVKYNETKMKLNNTEQDLKLWQKRRKRRIAR